MSFNENWDGAELKTIVKDYLIAHAYQADLIAVYNIHSLADLCATSRIADYLIERAAATPYFDLDGYMERNWLFNPYETYEQKQVRRAAGGAEPEYTGPSGRIHHILRADEDRALHDHPWDARTIVLRGWYLEERLLEDGTIATFRRGAGDTATLNFGEFHRIYEVSPGGVWTLFITEQYQGTWGFLVDGVKIPYREYLGLP